MKVKLICVCKYVEKSKNEVWVGLGLISRQWGKFGECGVWDEKRRIMSVCL